MFKKIINYIPLLYVIASVLEVFSITASLDTLWLLSRIISIVLIILLYFLSAKKRDVFYIVVLYINFIADVFLFDLLPSLPLGLISLLCTRILYVIIIYRFLPTKFSVLQSLSISIPFLITFGVIFYILSGSLKGNMVYIIFCYGLASASLGSIVFINYLSKINFENFQLFLGVFIFIIADSISALQRFEDPSLSYRAIIAFLYAIAQYLVCRVMISKSFEEKLK